SDWRAATLRLWFAWRAWRQPMRPVTKRPKSTCARPAASCSPPARFSASCSPWGAAAQKWQQREALKPLPDAKPVPILYVSADATGLPIREEELKGRAGKQPDGSAKTRSALLGCAFTQHKRDEKGHPVRDYESTTYVSS